MHYSRESSRSPHSTCPQVGDRSANPTEAAGTAPISGWPDLYGVPGQNGTHELGQLFDADCRPEALAQVENEPAWTSRYALGRVL